MDAISFVESDYARVYKTTSKRRAMMDKHGTSETTSPVPPTKPLPALGASSEAQRAKTPSNGTLQRKARSSVDKVAVTGKQEGRQISTPDPEPGTSKSAVKRAPRGFARKKGSGPRTYMGVQATPSGRFKAKIYIPRTKKHIYIGIYNTPEEAAHAYDEVAYRKRGAGAPLNFPEEYPPTQVEKPKPKKVVIQLTDAGDFEAMCYDAKLKSYRSVGVFSSIDAARKASDKEAATMESSGPEGIVKDRGESSSAHEDSEPPKPKLRKSSEVTHKRSSATKEHAPKLKEEKEEVKSALAKEPVPPAGKVSAPKKPSRRGSSLTRRADFRGVYCNGHKFQSIYYNPATKKHTYLGTFLTAVEAARAHDQVL